MGGGGGSGGAVSCCRSLPRKGGGVLAAMLVDYHALGPEQAAGRGRGTRAEKPLRGGAVWPAKRQVRQHGGLGPGPVPGHGHGLGRPGDGDSLSCERRVDEERAVDLGRHGEARQPPRQETAGAKGRRPRPQTGDGVLGQLRWRPQRFRRLIFKAQKYKQRATKNSKIDALRHRAQERWCVPC